MPVVTSLDLGLRPKELAMIIVYMISQVDFSAGQMVPKGTYEVSQFHQLRVQLTRHRAFSGCVGTARPPQTWADVAAGVKRLLALESTSHDDAVEDLMARYVSHAKRHRLCHTAAERAQHGNALLEPISDLTPADLWHELTRDLTCATSSHK